MLCSHLTVVASLVPWPTCGYQLHYQLYRIPAPLRSRAIYCPQFGCFGSSCCVIHYWGRPVAPKAHYSDTLIIWKISHQTENSFFRQFVTLRTNSHQTKNTYSPRNTHQWMVNYYAEWRYFLCHQFEQRISLVKHIFTHLEMKFRLNIFYHAQISRGGCATFMRTNQINYMQLRPLGQ